MGSAALFQFGCVALCPTVDRGVIDMQSSLAHHLLQISVAERIPQVPADTKQNDLGLEVTPFEWSGGIHEIGSSQFSEYRRVYRILAIFATQPEQRKLKKYIKYDIFQTEAHDVRSTIRV
jgi:hypothetical protein